MKRTITTLALVAGMLLAAAPPVLATHPEAPPVSENRPGNDECRPGADNDKIGPWELMDKDAYKTAILEAFPDADWDRVAASADATWDFCDHNRDELLCVFKSTLTPGTFWLLLDNRPFGGKG